MESNRSNSTNNYNNDNNQDNSIWEIIENLEDNHNLPINNLELLHHSPDYYLRNAAAGDMAAPIAGRIQGGTAGGRVIGDWELRLNEEENNMANEIGDFNYVVGTPDVPQMPSNQIAHFGGGDAELIFDPQLVEQEFNQPASEMDENIIDGDEPIDATIETGTEPDTGDNETENENDEVGIIDAQALILMEEYLNHREALTEVQVRSAQEILRLCDYIQRQLMIIAAQIECYENKLNEHYASLAALTSSTSATSSSSSSSSLPLEPDGDAI